MKFNSLFTTRAVAAAVLLVPFAARADQWDKKTILTVHQEIQVRDRVLEPGKYVFKLLNTNADRHVVQIYNADESRIIDTILAIPDYRLRPTGRSQFRFYETPTGYVKALQAWFYPGDNFGQEFTYPKHLTQLAMASVAAPAPVWAPQPQPEPEAAAAPAPMPAPEPVVEQPAPAEMAQNSPPAQPAAPQAEPVAPSHSLPKTASPYPLVGLGGLLFMAGFGLLRLKRSV